MRPGDLSGFALHAILAQRLRSLLTMLGILVGIAAVVLLTSIGEGVRQFVLGEFTQFGTNIIAVVPGKSNTFGASGATISTTRPLNLEDATALLRVDNVQAVVPMVQGNADVEFAERNRRTMVFGVGRDMPAVWKMDVQVGRFLPDADFGAARSFAVLGSKMREELFGADNPLGARVRVGGQSFRVIGVMESKGQMLGFDLDDTIFVPIARALELFNLDGLMEVDIIYDPAAGTAAVLESIRRLMIARHGQEDFTLISQDQMLEVLDSVLGVITIGIGALGGISLLVGAVGILTIMNIAIAERTGEIGLLRAIGARRRHVLYLFLGEAVMLGMAGGVAGIAVALLIIQLLGWTLSGFPVATSWPWVALSFTLAAAIGLLAGIVPALRAAALAPLEALRAE